jgi:hypothetical protein
VRQLVNSSRGADQSTDGAGLTASAGPPHPPWSVDQAIAIACLVGPAALGSLHVAASPRPTYAEILRYKRLAAGCGFALTVTASRLVLRPEFGTARVAGDPVGWRSWLARLRDLARRHADDEAPRSC